MRGGGKCGDGRGGVKGVFIIYDASGLRAGDKCVSIFMPL